MRNVLSVKRYTTASGSAYEVDEDRKMIRRTTRSAVSTAERVGEDWRPYEYVSLSIFGGLHIVWGSGRDEHSAKAIQVGEGRDEDVTRVTETTPIVSVEEVDR